MVTERQEKILKTLVREYINKAVPISSQLLKEKTDLNVSPATIRNELQKLTKSGYIIQPHISAGRIPTKKAYKYFIDEVFNYEEKALIDFIFREIRNAECEIRKELRAINKLSKILKNICKNFRRRNLLEKNNLCHTLIKISYSKTTWKKNQTVIQKIIKEIKNFI